MMIPSPIASRGARRYLVARSNSSWLITFADMAILMVAFFAVIISFSEINPRRFDSMASTMGSRFGDKKGGTSLVAILPEPSTSALPPPVDLDMPAQNVEPTPIEPDLRTAMADHVMEDLSKQFEPLLANAAIKMQHSPQRIVLSLGASGFFQSGSAELDRDALQWLNHIGRIAGTAPVTLAIEGHADSKPVMGGRFRDNWELAAARAAAVLNTLAESSGLPASSFKIVSYGSSRPVALETDTNAQARNRRVEIEITYQQ